MSLNDMQPVDWRQAVAMDDHIGRITLMGLAVEYAAERSPEDIAADLLIDTGLANQLREAWRNLVPESLR